MRRKRRTPITFRVRWEIDIEASSAIDAVLAARRQQVTPHTTAVVFDAWPSLAPSRANRIDLLAVHRTRVEPADLLLATIEAFPGLIDGNTEVNGSNLVEFLTNTLRELTHLDDIVAAADRRTQS